MWVVRDKQLARVLAASYAVGTVCGYWSDETSLTSAHMLTAICQGQRRQLLLRTSVLRLFSRWLLGLASISFSLLSFNASEPDGRSRFRRLIVYGQIRTSEQEFITWHQKLRPGMSSSGAWAPWYPTLWRPICQLIQRSAAGSQYDFDEECDEEAELFLLSTVLNVRNGFGRRSLHRGQCLWYEQNRLADLCNWDAGRKLLSYQM